MAARVCKTIRSKVPWRRSSFASDICPPVLIPQKDVIPYVGTQQERRPAQEKVNIFIKKGRLKDSQMVVILCLQRTYQDFKFRKAVQVLQARVFQKKWPACESGADTPFQPF